MLATKIAKILSVSAAVIALATVPGSIATADSVDFVTCVGGASGMTLTLNPYTGSVVRGCAPKVLDYVLQDYNAQQGTVQQVYTRVRMKNAALPTYSEPTPASWGTDVKFTGDGSDCEIQYLVDRNDPNHVWFSMAIQKDSVVGLRFAVNRQSIYAFTSAAAMTTGTDGVVTGGYVYDINKVNKESDPVVSKILNYLGFNTTNGTLTQTIPIEGGLTECYMDSGWRGIDEWNNTYNPTNKQPQLYAPNFSTTVDNLLSVAVLGVIYNKCGMPSTPLNITTQMERLITGGFADNWDQFFNVEGIHIPLTNVYREPLSGTAITYKSLIMRGVKQSPNGTKLTAGPASQTDVNNQTCTFATAFTNPNIHGSGVPGIDCMPKTTDAAIGNNPGGGRVNDYIDWNKGAHGYTFLQKFQNAAGTLANLKNIRVATINGYSPYDFSAGNSLPGINGVADVDDNTNATYYANVVEGKYPLWTYNHCFAWPGTYQVGNSGKTVVSKGLADFLVKFTTAPGAPAIRSVGLIPLGDMTSEQSVGRTPITNANSPNYNRGPAWARCGFYSPITGEIVRDGMMMIQNDPNGPDSMPGEPYVEMRP